MDSGGMSFRTPSGLYYPYHLFFLNETFAIIRTNSFNWSSSVLSELEREEEKRKRRGREEEEKRKRRGREEEEEEEEEGRRRKKEEEEEGGVWRGSSRSFNMMQNKEVSLSVRLLCCCIQARLPVDIGPRRWECLGSEEDLPASNPPLLPAGIGAARCGAFRAVATPAEICNHIQWYYIGLSSI